jgi:hypothetical protein
MKKKQNCWRWLDDTLIDPLHVPCSREPWHQSVFPPLNSREYKKYTSLPLVSLLATLW